MYLTYEEYKALGGSHSEVDFARFVYAAGKTVQGYTFSRVDSMASVPEAVRRLMVELIQLEANTESTRTGAGSLKSFSTDGYSESYADAPDTKETDALREDLVMRYLAEETDDNGTPLLYCGVNV